MQLIDYLISQLRSCATYNSAVQIAPTAILWTDIDRQWQCAMPFIKQHLPELVELGGYNPEQRIGPAIWIKCAIARMLDEDNLPSDKTPIIYLPGVGRKDLRAIEQCPDDLRPLAELQYRGCWWAYNTAGRDWSVNSFLTNPRVGLSLDVAKDKHTSDAILKILPDLLETPAESLQGKRLESEDFIRIVMDDPAKDILGWLNNPIEKRTSWANSKWPIFNQACINQYDFDPENTPIEQILSKLCAADDDVWASVWQRFEDTAHNLPLLVDKMSQLEPDGLAFNASHYLSENIKDESEIAATLAQLTDKETTELKIGLRSLFDKQSERKSWIWTKLRRSPWLAILEQLIVVIQHTEIPFTGPNVEHMADSYKDKFWQADAAALQAMAVAKDINQQQIVANTLAEIYTPWLEQVALNFQNLVRLEGYPGNQASYREVNESTASYLPGSQIVFFVDGLRFDTAKSLQEKLAKRNVSTDFKTNWCALPSLTATAKAAVTPVFDKLTGAQENDNFTPMLIDTQADFTAYHFKKLLEANGWQYLDGLETGNTDGIAWVQTGDLDNMGHEFQMTMPRNIDNVLEDVVARVLGLMDAGWKHIRIVTDHGWLWVPSKLTEAHIAKTVVKKRLARCAILKDNADSPELKVPWHWNADVTVAMAPGISGYVAGDYYNHGGLTLQECLTPVINIRNEQR